MISQVCRFLKTGYLLSMIVSLALMSHWAMADGVQQFSDKAFLTAQDSNETIVLDYYADWCPTCRRQKPALTEALKAPDLSKVVAFQVDFDEQPATLKKIYKVTNQSTLIILKGKTLKAQQTGMTDPQEIQHLVEKGL